MNKLASISLWLLALLASVCLSACSSDDDVDAGLCPEESGVFIRISFNTTSAGDTRAVPQGDEDGDGTENGKNHENDIHNICIFIYRDVNGLAAGSETVFLHKSYFVHPTAVAEWTEPTPNHHVIKYKITNYIPQDGDRIIAIANAGNLTHLATLGALRDHVEYSSWQNDASISNNDFFVMSTAYNKNTEGIITTTGFHGSDTDPFQASEMQIRRTAARIDFMYNSTENIDGGFPNDLVYNVHEDPENLFSTVIGTMHLQNIIPVNLMQQATYMIKRLAPGSNIAGAVSYGAEETIDGSGIPTNYVIEPHTLLKQSPVVDATLTNWYGTTRAKTVCDNVNTYLTTATSISNYLTTHSTLTGHGYFVDNITLAYTNENTQSKEHNDPNFMTGLLLKAIYEPKTVYTDAAATVLDGTNNYAAGHTFWRYSPTSTEMAEKDCKYFENEAAATAYKAAHPEDMAEIDMFTNGVCYYNIWLRHANIDEDDPHLTFPMEYGIVRNNIYRVGIEKVTGPGTALPEMKDPDHIYLRIFVRKWNLRVQPTIRL